jgi:DNA-binding NarL/FixJ family response regulator
MHPDPTLTPSSPDVPSADADAEGDVRPHLRVVIADPDPLARRAVRDELESRPRFVVVAEAADGTEALELCRRHQPELLITEAALPRIDGIALTRRLHAEAPDIRVLLFAVESGPDIAIRALRAGAAGYLSKDDGLAAVGAALAAVARGEAAVSRLLTMRLIERLRMVPEAGTGIRPVKSNLTSREWEVLDLLVSGAGTTRIAKTLFLTQDTVYSHIKSIMRKLDVRTREEAVSVAAGLIDPTLTAAPGPGSALV